MEVAEVPLAVSVQALISAFETKVPSEKLPIKKRSGSLGNILNKNIIVKMNQFTTLDDIQKFLDEIEPRLKKYVNYDKAKHVAFQEELFNALTNIINTNDDNPTRAKNLIQKTKSLVTQLNNILPSITVANSVTSKNSSSSLETFKVEESNQSYSEAKVITEGRMSVKMIKEKFQSRSISELQQPIKPKIIKNTIVAETPKMNGIVKTSNVVIKTEKREVSQEISKDTRDSGGDQQRVSEDYKKTVSVSHLRNLFETKSKENSGLPSILNEYKTTTINRVNYKEGASQEDLNRIQVSSYLLKREVDEPSKLMEILEKNKYQNDENFSKSSVQINEEHNESIVKYSNNIRDETTNYSLEYTETNSINYESMEYINTEHRQGFHYELSINDETNDDSGANSLDVMSALEYNDPEGDDRNDVESSSPMDSLEPVQGDVQISEAKVVLKKIKNEKTQNGKLEDEKVEFD